MLQPHPPVPIPVLEPHFELLIQRFPTLKDFMVAAEFDELTLHFSNFISSHLSPLGRTTVPYITVFCFAGLCCHLPYYSLCTYIVVAISGLHARASLTILIHLVGVATTQPGDNAGC